MKEWFTKLFSGQDNESPAVGRVLGSFGFIVLLILVPSTAIYDVTTAPDHASIWATFFPSLGAYVVMAVGAIAGLITYTSKTEPRKD